MASTVVTVLQVICGIILIIIILFQSGKSAGLSGAIAGVADSFMSQHEAKTADAKMARATKWIGAVFIVLTLSLSILH
jgi:preprotein translocase subunit SecG